MFDQMKTLIEARMNGDYDTLQLVMSSDQLKTYTDLVVKQAIETIKMCEEETEKVEAWARKLKTFFSVRE